MRFGELQRQKDKALTEMKENVELLIKGESVSEDVFMDAADRYYDAVLTQEAATEIGGADPSIDVDTLLRKVRAERSNRAVNRICQSIRRGATATGKALAKTASGVLKFAGSACQAGVKALDKTQSQ